jgi:hypothetical protein
VLAKVLHGDGFIFWHASEDLQKFCGDAGGCFELKWYLESKTVKLITKLTEIYGLWGECYRAKMRK